MFTQDFNKLSRNWIYKKKSLLPSIQTSDGCSMAGALAHDDTVDYMVLLT